jgi:uncharacterized protein YecT (DUF1311 family)
MSQYTLLPDEPQPVGDTHNDANNKKAKAGKVDAVDMGQSEQRSWIQSRTTELVLKEFPDGNSFESSDWSRCYAQARKEWNEKE